MIQFKRGTTESWKKLKTPLAAGQPGYDKDKHKIKVGDGEKLWEKLPYAGLSEEEVLDSEEAARTRLLLDPESMAIITYGTESPDKDTVGQLYLQYYDTEPEVDYIVSYGIHEGWQYRKWHSGRAECYGILEVSTTITENIGSIYCATEAVKNIKYPFTFKDVPTEVATVQSPGGIVWLACKGMNTENKTASYTIISPDSQANTAIYRISIHVSGFWK